jgi:hypothetical protein
VAGAQKLTDAQKEEYVAAAAARKEYVALAGLQKLTDAQKEEYDAAEVAAGTREKAWWLGYYGLQADAVRPKSQASPGAGDVGVAQTAPLVLVAVGALLATVARRRSAPASTML